LGFGLRVSVDDDTSRCRRRRGVAAAARRHRAGGLKCQPDHPGALRAGKNISLPYSGPASDQRRHLYNAISSQQHHADPITTPSEHNLSEGANVVIDQVGGDPAANGTFKIGNVSPLTFDLFDAATGKVPGPRAALTPPAAGGAIRSIPTSIAAPT
jgi:hypothetical protein